MEGKEATTTLLEADLTDEDDVAVSSAVISSASMVITSAETGASVVAAVSVLSSIDTSGHIAITLTPAQMAMIDRTNTIEFRNVRITFVWSSTKGAVLGFAFGVRRVDP